jgi:5-exo-hydroxycamphor dehydrogenase
MTTDSGSAPMVGRQVVFRGAGAALELRSDSVGGPEADSVLVEVELAGVCGTDAHRVRGDLPDPPAPIAFGHEAIGRVVALGERVRTDSAGAPLAEGDRLYWTVSGPCGRCYGCTVARNPLDCVDAVWPPRADTPNPAGFQQFATIGRRLSFFRVPDDTPSEAVIAFGCAMPTALGGFRRLGHVAPASTVVIQGCGPVGLACTVLAGLSPATQVIVIGGAHARLEAADRLGATTTISIDIAPAQRRDAVLDLTGGRGADIVIEAAGHVSAFTEGLDLLAAHGRFLLLGLYSGASEVSFNPVTINNRNLTVLGSLGVDPGDYLTTIGLAQRHHARLSFGDLVTHRFPLEQLIEAIEATESGEAVKAVVCPSARV